MRILRALSGSLNVLHQELSSLTQTMCFLPHPSPPEASASALTRHISSLCYLTEVPLACLQSSRGPQPSGWSRCEWPWDKTLQTCWSYTNQLFYPSRFLLLGLMPVPGGHISGRNYVGGWIPSCPAVTWTLSFFTSCGIKVTLISGRTILERQLVQKDAKMESALCCGEGVQTAINGTCVIILWYAMRWITTTSFLNINNCFSSLSIQAGDVQLC